MKYSNISVWKTSPFLRLLIPLAAGILIQWYIPVPVNILLACLVSFILIWIGFRLLPVGKRYHLFWLQGLSIQVCILIAGTLLSYQNDIRLDKAWYGNKYHDGDLLLITINESLVEKSKTYKAESCVSAVIHCGTMVPTSGKMLIYFSKDSSSEKLQYGDRILFQKQPQRIENSGNPGAFNYKSYAAAHQLYHNVFLTGKDWAVLSHKETDVFRHFIIMAREAVLNVIRSAAANDSGALGIAEALLIGYTNDLDKDLQQAYSNTGVVHIIAISGMHLGLIYVMLVWFFARMPVIKRSQWLQLVFILGCLWLFSFLTGATASVIRSAVMFTFIAVGKCLKRESSVYNSLAASAFVMLCVDPYYLKDVGFQLSYLAVVGIVSFQKSLYGLLFAENKWLDNIWKSIAVTLSAQVLTFPVCIYYFHQFPNLFLFTNMIAVPLSGIILYVEIAYVVLSRIPYLGYFLGKIVFVMINIMNKAVLYMNGLPFSVWDNLSVTVSETFFLYMVVIFLAAWFMYKKRKTLYIALIAGFALMTNIAIDKWIHYSQQKIIIYNIPHYQAVDIVVGNNYQFIGDSVLTEDGILQNFHIKPGRIALHLENRKKNIEGTFQQPPFYYVHGKRICIIDKSVEILPLQDKIVIDILLISKNPKINIWQLTQAFTCREIVLDASNSLWKIAQWKKECEELHLRCFSVPAQGAYVLDIAYK